MTERTKRLCAVCGSVLSALSIALALLAFVSIGVFAETDTGMPAVSDVIPDENGTSVLPLPEDGNVDSDTMIPGDTTLSPALTSDLPVTTARPDTTTSPTGTDTEMLEEEGGGMLGAIIAVIVVVAIILVVIALIPRKKS